MARSRVVDLALMVLIACAFFAAVILFAEFGPVPWLPSQRWWGLAGMTGLMLWYVVAEYRRHWRDVSFWLHVGWLTALHLAAWAFALSRAEEWGLLWFVPPIALEAAALVYVLHKLGYAPGQKHGAA